MREYLLGRVIVTEDLKSAVAVSNELRNFSRIVTLEGGSDFPRRSDDRWKSPTATYWGLLTRKQELEELVVQAQEVKGQLARTDETIAQCLQEIDNWESEQKKLQEQMQYRLVEQAAVQRDLAGAKSSYERIEAVLHRVLEQQEQIASQGEEVVAQQRKTQQQMARAQALVQQIEEQLAELDAQLAAADRLPAMWKKNSRDCG